MNWNTILIPIFAFSICSQCFADRYLHPVKAEGQEEILVNGASVLLSEKRHKAVMYQASEMVEGRRANFFFAFENMAQRPITLHFCNLTVTDQYGNPIRIVPKQELIADKKSKANWLSFLSVVCTGIESANAQQAGRTDYYSTTSGSGHYNSNSIGSNGWGSSSGSFYGASSTQGVIYSEAERQRALRQVNVDSGNRLDNITQSLEAWEYGLDNFYFDSNTVFPNKVYSANLQIDIPNHLEKQIEYLVFHLNVGDEIHTFYFYCGLEEKKWYHIF